MVMMPTPHSHPARRVLLALQVLMGLRATVVQQEFLEQVLLSQWKALVVFLVVSVVTQARAA
jgi:hypothetical protein